MGARIGSAPLLVRVPGQLALKAGDAVQLGWDAAHQYFFDKSTGLRHRAGQIEAPPHGRAVNF